ncbi:MAG: cell division protein ZipA [Idiomarinaceae bacterium HL-53]|nr:MAG: cell division protein ZipA [Idiomarinaceae bacterium HL-53]CUS48675.1 cell division protein ZipA [Idiomarinaceae bacterium HL-53]
MDGVRLVLIVLGLIVILGLLGHGLWSIRKNQQGARRNYNNQKNMTSAERVRAKVDEGGFDEYGIGKVRTIKKPEPEPKSKAKPKPQTQGQAQAEQRVAPQPEAKPEKKEPSIAQQGLFEEIEATQPKQSKRKEPSLGAEQIALSFEETSQVEREISDEDENQVEQEPAAPAESEVEVVTLFVSGDIQGAILLQTLTELGLKYGELDIFHRHEDTAGKGTKLFSVADMYNPGVFDLDAIENFSTRGVALFMTLPMKADGHNAFTMMYNAANKIAEAMPRAAVLDGNRNPITKQSVQHTYQKIREFERRQKVSSAAR